LLKNYKPKEFLSSKKELSFLMDIYKDLTFINHNNNLQTALKDIDKLDFIKEYQIISKFNKNGVNNYTFRFAIDNKNNMNNEEISNKFNKIIEHFKNHGFEIVKS